MPLYRLLVLVAIFFCARWHWQRVNAELARPPTIRELRAFFPTIDRLEPSDTVPPRLVALDAEETPLGYALSTSPGADAVIGYVGPSESLVVFSEDDRFLGAVILRSADTPGHVDDVKNDSVFLSRWKGKSREELAGLAREGGEVDGVAGATRTSQAVARAVLFTAAAQAGERSAAGFSWRMADSLNAFAALGGILLCFFHFTGKRWVRRAFQLGVFIFVGLVYGDLLSLGVWQGWLRAGIAWHAAPGLVLLAATALVIPWASRRPVYCGHICPFGAVQEWMGRLVPTRMQWKMSPGTSAGLRHLPTALLTLSLITIMTTLPMELAHLEPFDAFRPRRWLAFSVGVAAIGLVLSGFVPMGYCRFACPTGEIFRYVRSHGAADGFHRADAVAGMLVVLAFALAGGANAVTVLLGGGA
jgi:NosR/NirI family transcriptional regulator, nitrous oxide reductase regulator